MIRPIDQSIDLADLDTTGVSWADRNGEAGLYGVAPAGGVTVADGLGDGRSGCSGSGCVCGRPITWCCVNCH